MTHPMVDKLGGDERTTLPQDQMQQMGRLVTNNCVSSVSTFVCEFIGILTLSGFLYKSLPEATGEEELTSISQLHTQENPWGQCNYWVGGCPCVEHSCGLCQAYKAFHSVRRSSRASLDLGI